jgi:DNA-binding GntR family transcriptional regulator
VLSSRERFARSVASYHDFLVACEAHDPDRAERVVTDSMRWAVDLVADSLPSERELQPPGR